MFTKALSKWGKTDSRKVFGLAGFGAASLVGLGASVAHYSATDTDGFSSKQKEDAFSYSRGVGGSLAGIGLVGAGMAHSGVRASIFNQSSKMAKSTRSTKARIEKEGGYKAAMQNAKAAKAANLSDAGNFTEAAGYQVGASDLQKKAGGVLGSIANKAAPYMAAGIMGATPSSTRGLQGMTYGTMAGFAAGGAASNLMVDPRDEGRYSGSLKAVGVLLGGVAVGAAGGAGIGQAMTRMKVGSLTSAKNAIRNHRRASRYQEQLAASKLAAG